MGVLSETISAIECSPRLVSCSWKKRRCLRSVQSEEAVVGKVERTFRFGVDISICESVGSRPAGESAKRIRGRVWPHGHPCWAAAPTWGTVVHIRFAVNVTFVNLIWLEFNKFRTLIMEFSPPDKRRMTLIYEVTIHTLPHWKCIRLVSVKSPLGE